MLALGEVNVEMKFFFYIKEERYRLTSFSRCTGCSKTFCKVRWVKNRAVSEGLLNSFLRIDSEMDYNLSHSVKD